MVQHKISFHDAIRRALEALDVPIQDADDLELIDLEVAESALCWWERIPDEMARQTDGFADALAAFAECLGCDLSKTIGAAALLSEKRRLCSYDGAPNEDDITEAEEARQNVYSALEALLGSDS